MSNQPRVSTGKKMCDETDRGTMLSSHLLKVVSRLSDVSDLLNDRSCVKCLFQNVGGESSKFKEFLTERRTE